MARTLVRKIHVGRCEVAIRRDTTWQEYVVITRAPKPFVGSYHTPDKDDARSTAAKIIRSLRRTGVCR